VCAQPMSANEVLQRAHQPSQAEAGLELVSSSGGATTPERALTKPARRVPRRKRTRPPSTGERNRDTYLRRRK
jgi:hypothetical protein